VVSFAGREMLRDFGIRGDMKDPSPRNRWRRCAGFPQSARPSDEPFAEQQICSEDCRITEVCEKQPRRFALQNRGEGSIPDPEIDVPAAESQGMANEFPSNARRRIANEGDAFRLSK